MLGDGPTYTSLLYAADLREELQRFLNPNEWETLVLRYGLAQHAPHTVPEVAQLMDTNTAHTHRVLKGAFKKLHSDRHGPASAVPGGVVAVCCTEECAVQRSARVARAVSQKEHRRTMRPGLLSPCAN